MEHHKECKKLHTTFNTIADNVDKENEKSIKFFYDKTHQKITIGGEKV